MSKGSNLIGHADVAVSNVLRVFSARRLSSALRVSGALEYAEHVFVFPHLHFRCTERWDHRRLYPRRSCSLTSTVNARQPKAGRVQITPAGTSIRTKLTVIPQRKLRQPAQNQRGKKQQSLVERLKGTQCAPWAACRPAACSHHRPVQASLHSQVPLSVDSITL